MNEDEVCVRKVSGEPEAQQIRALLEANGIPCRLSGEAVRKTHALTVDGLGEVSVLVGREDAGRAADLLRRADAGELALDATESEG